jgi:hypothetical protein
MGTNASVNEPIHRYARDDERARIEAARPALRRSAYMSIGMGLVIPGVITIVTTVSAFATYPGSFLEKALVSVLSMASVGLVFTLPMVLTSSGRALALHRALMRDAALGFRVVRVRGDVAWDRRRRALVARAGGRRLASPFFTGFESVPLFWDHFDQLAPRSYDFEILEASGFALNASPASSSEPEGYDDHPGNVALREAFRVEPVDLEANRCGLATAKQRRRLLLAYVWVLILGPLAFGIATGIRSVVAAPHLGAIVGLLIALALALFVVRLSYQVAVDAVRGEVVSGTGVVHLSYGKTETSATVGGMTFTIPHHQARALQPNVRYRVYAFRRSGQATSAELADLR